MNAKLAVQMLFPTPESDVQNAAGTLLLLAYAAYGTEQGFYGAVAALVAAANPGK